MTWTVIDNIGTLVTNDPEAGEAPLGLIRDAAVVIGDGAVQWVGPARRVPDGSAGVRYDLDGRAALPGFGRWPRTAIRGPVTPPVSRSASRLRSARCT
jgi:imidazolonepropionase-like amidohydrolase